MRLLEGIPDEDYKQQWCVVWVYGNTCWASTFKWYDGVLMEYDDNHDDWLVVSTGPYWTEFSIVLYFTVDD